METRKTQNRIAATINELAAFIREHAPVKFGAVCMAKKIAPSTLHGYIRIMLDVTDDITFEHGLFTVKREQLQRK